MNRELGYVWRGALLLLVVLAGLCIVWMLEPGPSSKPDVGQISTSTTIDSSLSESAYLRGSILFRDNCHSCHLLDGTEPNASLLGVENRVKDRKLLIGWIRNSDSVLRSGNRYFNDLFKKWNKTPMTTFPNLTDENIECILTYIRYYDGP